jgi:dephospho-CoA kinase
MQLPIDSKKASSDFIIENCGELEQTMRQVEQLWAKIANRA